MLIAFYVILLFVAVFVLIVGWRFSIWCYQNYQAEKLNQKALHSKSYVDKVLTQSVEFFRVSMRPPTHLYCSKNVCRHIYYMLYQTSLIVQRSTNGDKYLVFNTCDLNSGTTIHHFTNPYNNLSAPSSYELYIDIVDEPDDFLLVGDNSTYINFCINRVLT